MEGLSNNSNTTYLRISGGKIWLKTNESNPQAVKRITKKGETVFEQPFTSLSGVISKMYINESIEYGDTLVLSVLAGEATRYSLPIPINSNTFKSFVNLLPNVNIKEPLTISTWIRSIENDKTLAGVSISQNGKKVPPYFKTFDKETSQFIYKGGYPKLDLDKKMSAAQRGVYNLKVIEFLTSYLHDNGYLHENDFDSNYQEIDINDSEKTDLPF